MDYFNYRNEQLFAEDLPVKDIADTYGTPCYIYSRATLERHWHAFNNALGAHPHRICYAVKANDNLGILSVLAKLGSGFDIVSGGELERVLAAGGKAENIIFSGIGKTHQEIKRALTIGIHCFNVESLPELLRIHEIAQACKLRAPIALRVNPDVDAKTHPYISTGLKENKFGIPAEEILSIYQQASQLPYIEIKGIACHIGSQLMSLDPFLDALEKILQFVDNLASHNIALSHIDLGGGLGAPYTANDNPPSPEIYAKTLLQRIKKNYPHEIILEPGRAIAANAGILVTKVEYLKETSHKNFAIVDAGMNDLLRPALYDAWHDIIPVTLHPHLPLSFYDIVGPICESADCFGKQRQLAIQPNDLLAFRSAGAYGAVMSSHYNARPRPAELLIDKNKIYVVREREMLTELYANEKVVP